MTSLITDIILPLEEELPSSSLPKWAEILIILVLFTAVFAATGYFTFKSSMKKHNGISIDKNDDPHNNE